MLLIWDVTSATDAKNYYATSVSPGTDASRQDYYSEGQEIGRPVRRQARRNGWGSPASSSTKETFDRLCDNLHPVRGRTADAAHQRVPAGLQGFHLLRAQIVFRSSRRSPATRSASSCGKPSTKRSTETVDRGHRARHANAGCAKTGRIEDRATGNMLRRASITPRPGRTDANTLPDPHWHRHVLVWNATYDPVEDRIKAGQFGDIVRDKALLPGGVLLPAGEQAGSPGLRHRPARRQRVGNRRGPAIDDRQVQQADRRNRGRSREAGHHRCRPQGGARGEDPRPRSRRS